MLATLSGSKRFMLNDGQAQIMGDAVAEFTKYYPIVPSGKTGALLGLATASFMVYTPMVMGLAADNKAAKAQQRNKATVMPATPEEMAPVVEGGIYKFN